METSRRCRGAGVRMMRFVWSWTVVLGLLAAPALGEPDKEARDERRPVSDTGRFYLYFQSGHAGVIDDHVAGRAELDTPDGINVVLGGGAGYNISDHWGVELQGHGTEPDIRMDGRKNHEFSNIAVMPAVRFRWPLGNRLVPFATAGMGFSLNEVNDTGEPHIKIEADRSSLVGSIAVGADYFLADDVAVGLSIHSFIYPDVDTELIQRDQANRIVLHDRSSVNFTSIAGLAHIKLFLGEGGPPGKRRLFLADHGPFDTDDIRFYIYAVGGHTQQFSDDFGGDVTMKAPGDFNATLGGGIGVNMSKHWGADLQLLNTEPNVNFTAIGKFAELSTFTILPAARFRWQLCGGRLVPYATAGIGIAFLDVNDQRTLVDQFGVGTVRTPHVDIQRTKIVGSVGMGIEYFLNRHISVGIAVPAYIYPDADTEIAYGSSRAGPGQGQAGSGVAHDEANLSSIAVLLQLKAYIP